MRFTLDFSGQNEGHKKSFLFVCSHGLKIYASSTKKGKPMKKQEIIAAIAGSVLAASIFTGCVIGHAKFEGEDMHLYPFWQTNAETSSAQASAEVE